MKNSTTSQTMKDCMSVTVTLKGHSQQRHANECMCANTKTLKPPLGNVMIDSAEARTNVASR